MADLRKKFVSTATGISIHGEKRDDTVDESYLTGLATYALNEQS